MARKQAGEKDTRLNVSGACFQFKEFELFGFSTFAERDVLAAERHLRSESNRRLPAMQHAAINLLLLQRQLLLLKFAYAIVQLRQARAGEDDNVGKI